MATQQTVLRSTLRNHRMIRKLFDRLGLGTVASAPVGAWPSYQPYAEAHVNHLYNLLFCDNLALFHNDEVSESSSLWATLLAESPDYTALTKIAQDEKEESRIRALAFNRLRAGGHEVPAKKIFGVVVEVVLEQGLDVLAAYSDGRVRYLNQSGKIAIFEGGPPQVELLAKELVALSQTLVNAIGPWKEKRLPPPPRGNVRMTFLVSDGLYFGEGRFEALQQDAMGGPVLAKASELLQRAVNAVVK